MAKRAEKTKFDRYPHINLVPFILETTGRPGPHARKFINYLLRNANIRKQEKEIAVSVVLIIVRGGEVTAGPHGTAAAGLRLKTLCALPAGRYLHP